jgi:hypothetical protein
MEAGSGLGEDRSRVGDYGPWAVGVYRRSTKTPLSEPRRLALASLFTPIKNWLQSFVDKRFKPVAPAQTGPMEDVQLTVDQRVALLEERLSRVERGNAAEDPTDW